MIEDKLGIKLKTLHGTRIPATDAYANKLNICLASKGLAECLRNGRGAVCERGSSGLLYDMTDIFEEYASDRVKAETEQFPEAVEGVGKINDRLANAIPQLGGVPAMACQVWWVRE